MYLKMNTVKYMLLFFTLLFLNAELAHAHRVTVFAWVEGDIVHTQSKFGGGKKAKNAVIEVYDNSGRKLLDGRTDENGVFDFKAPEKTGMTIVLVAGMGHRGEWTISAGEFGDADTSASFSAGSEEKTDAGSGNTFDPEKRYGGDEIQLAVEQALEKKLGPMLEEKFSALEQKMMSRYDDSPSMKDILGGIGYILGLIGVGTWFNYRRGSSK